MPSAPLAAPACPGGHGCPPPRRKKEEAAKRKEQAKILGKGRAKLTFSLG